MIGRDVLIWCQVERVLEAAKMREVTDKMWLCCCTVRGAGKGESRSIGWGFEGSHEISGSEKEGTWKI